MKLTTNFGLKKPEGSDVVNIDDFNYNADVLDNAIKEVKVKVDSLNLTANNVKMADGTTVQTTVTTNKSNISTLQSEVSANKTSILKNTDLVSQALNKANEAFQRGDNVKTQLVDKLISEGLNVSTNNTFEELISGIALGKKWASGIATTGYSSNADFNLLRTNYGSKRMYYIDIVGLNFRPSLVFYISKTELGYGVLSNLEQYRTEFAPYIYFVQGHPIDATTTMTTYGLRADSVVFLESGTVRLPAPGSSVRYNWIAFE